MTCVSDADCDDHRRCNGRERCAPRSAGADARGCVSGQPTVCPVNQVCSEGGAALADGRPDIRAGFKNRARAQPNSGCPGISAMRRRPGQQRRRSPRRPGGETRAIERRERMAALSARHVKVTLALVSRGDAEAFRCAVIGSLNSRHVVAASGHRDRRHVESRASIGSAADSGCATRTAFTSAPGAGGKIVAARRAGVRWRASASSRKASQSA